jgi:hypothetical protein
MIQLIAQSNSANRYLLNKQAGKGTF